MISSEGEPWYQYCSTVATAWAGNIPVQWDTRELSVLCADRNSEWIHSLPTKKMGKKGWKTKMSAGRVVSKRKKELNLRKENSQHLLKLRCWRQGIYRQRKKKSLTKSSLKSNNKYYLPMKVRSFAQVKTSIIIVIYIICNLIFYM